MQGGTSNLANSSLLNLMLMGNDQGNPGICMAGYTYATGPIDVAPVSGWETSSHTYAATVVSIV